MNVIVETPRLYLREITVNDAELAYHLNTDPEVLKYTGDASFTSIEDARQFLTNYTDYRKYGVGRWAVIRKEDEEFLGWCGLKYYEDYNLYDIGYRLYKRFWGNGFATESVKACIDWGFKNIKMEHIDAYVMEENIASIHVLTKCGFKCVREGDARQEMVFRVESNVLSPTS